MRKMCFFWLKSRISKKSSYPLEEINLTSTHNEKQIVFDILETVCSHEIHSELSHFLYSRQLTTIAYSIKLKVTVIETNNSS